LDFFKRLPTTRDETRVLDGYPGSHATLALDLAPNHGFAIILTEHQP
jgi:hypothetical protein